MLPAGLSKLFIDCSGYIFVIIPLYTETFERVILKMVKDQDKYFVGVYTVKVKRSLEKYHILVKVWAGSPARVRWATQSLFFKSGAGVH